jgi:hypothetical protein
MTVARRWSATACLLGAAACATDGPLAPRVAPAPVHAPVESRANPSAAADSAAPRVIVMRPTTRPTGPLLFVVDGQPVSADSAARLDRGAIESIELIMGAAAVSRHGPAGQHGVAIVKLRAPR